MICGHLDAELVALADSLVIEEPAPEDETPTARRGGEVHATRRLPRPPAPRHDDWFDSSEDDYCAAEGEVPFGGPAR